MPEFENTIKPEDRAARAAEELAAAGNQVSARAVRERSGVRMNIAAEAARAWNERAAEQQNVPEIPDEVRTRLDGIWRTAYVAARQDFDKARAGWVKKVETVEEDAAELTKTVAELEQRIEQERDESQKARSAAAQELAEARTESAEAQTRAAKLEGALEAVTAERDRLLTELQASRAVSNR